MTALLLNATFEPLTVVSRNRAVKMVIADRVDVLDADESAPQRAAKLTIPDPKVLHLREFVKVPYRPAPPPSRRAVFVRDRFTCQYCGAKGGDLTWDHVIPRSKGGTHTWDNLVTACKWCNSHKGDTFLEKLGWELRCTPSMPSGSFWVLITVKEPDPAWEPWLN